VAVVGYEDRMGEAFAMADLVLCRAGSSTLAELAATGKPSVLIPSPNVTDNHQEQNARGLEQAGAARVVVERGRAGAEVAAEAAGEIVRWMADPAGLARMGAAARGLARLSVAEQVAGLLEERFLKKAGGAS
jgi:UDP-N-acetylglucosamine--N-acetylmuramyl-(pentapeptide) pyrophosphoryl-undecaprenol N-acetylglucosamine transferase